MQIGQAVKLRHRLSQTAPAVQANLIGLRRPATRCTWRSRNFPRTRSSPYDLACVCCALGRLEEAQEWLRRVMDVGGKEIKLRAMDDFDLEPLWNEIG